MSATGSTERAGSRTPAWARPAIPPGSGFATKALLVAFAAATALDLGSLLAGWHTGHLIAKPLLMPLLVAYVITLRAPKLLIAALLFGWGGDLALLFDADVAFLIGMGSFAAGHVCYLALFGRRRTGPCSGPRTPPRCCPPSPCSGATCPRSCASRSPGTACC